MPFDFNHLLIVLTVYVIGAASPGPSNMRIMGVAMHQGRRPALMLAFGVISGSFFWGGMAATGISAILTTYAQAIIALKILGGAYLLFSPSRPLVPQWLRTSTRAKRQRLRPRFRDSSCTNRD